MKVSKLIGKKVMLADPTPTTHVGMYTILRTVYWVGGALSIAEAKRTGVEAFIVNDKGRNIKLSLSRFNTDSYK
jgi:hypothetical protein